MQFFACSLTREELLQDLLTAQYGRLNTVLRQASTLGWLALSRNKTFLSLKTVRCPKL